MNNWLESVALRISKRSRARKWAQFLARMNPGPEDRLIDVGVNSTENTETDNILERFYAYPKNVTAVGVEADFAAFMARRYPDVTAVTGDGTHLPFADDFFDIACSNAVIEHVGGRDKQLRFLQELHRVGKRGYLTTPNRHFPVEVHTRIPLLHLCLSQQRFDWVATKLGKGWATSGFMDLLSERDLRSLARDADISRYELIHNRFLGLSMTFTLVWNKHED